MSSEDDSDALENFLSQQKNKLKQRYLSDSELNNLKVTDDFIVSDSESDSNNEIIFENKENVNKNLSNENKNRLNNKYDKISIKKSISPLFSDLSDLENDESEDDDKILKKNKINNDLLENSINKSLFSENNQFLNNFIIPKKKPILKKSITKTCINKDSKHNKIVKNQLFETPSNKFVNNKISQTVPSKKINNKFTRLRVISDTDCSDNGESDDGFSFYDETAVECEDDKSSLNSDQYDRSFIDDTEESDSESEIENSSSLFSDSDDESQHLTKPSQFFTPKINNNNNNRMTIKQLTKTAPPKQHCRTKLDFISSLMDNVDEEKEIRDCEATKFRNRFKKIKNELALQIYKIYNEKVFLNKLPHDIDIKFYPRLLKTGGVCVCSRGKEHKIRIKLSTKVLTDAQRLLQTLVHEMCHGAVWMINKLNDHHGPVWRTWAHEAHRMFPRVPMSTRCHNYIINSKYEYWCLQCNLMVKRHSKSLNTNKKVCGKCRGRFTLFVNQETANGREKVKLEECENKILTGFPKFVKENYKKYRSTGTSHGEVMKILSSRYKQHKENDDLCNNMLASLNINSDIIASDVEN